ncbi:hypothetical protein ERO13_A07G080300v2 [Gossypium hirsutum]|uniref:Uncharacterized protein n=3 Tax=Gossypium TaxID=3633 RepID=A0ABR0PA94_GOSAR|nr:hypothetical protein ES319_A07G089600v1 [Gossypium barbadense]KAG4191253.1 hypothetical protein ERO13_A07G080300v2 [Gossypium hirsutum]KAK5818190.1 hypothetical protein PVK06_023123 [Gossypium arboreum]TYI18483.1 hypothetical protein ES332_A07G094100v1 [Gossypium tomentosum]
MGIIEKRKTNLLLASTVIIFLLKINHCGTAFIVKSNTSYNCNSRLDECRAVETFNSELVWELDMVMNSNFVRILASGGGTGTGNTGNANQPWQKPCPDPQYASCPPLGGKKTNCRGTFDRGCGRNH